MEDFEKTFETFELPNGLKVALKRIPNTAMVYGRTRVNHGSLNELPGEEGIAHFLEHVEYKGGTARFSPEEVTRLLRRFADYNALTGLDSTEFPVTMQPKMTDQYLSFISDVIFNPRLSKECVETERQRVLREHADDLSDAQKQAGSRFMKRVSNDYPTCYNGLGRKEVIEAATPEILRSFHDRGYSPNNTDIILVGALPEGIEDMIAGYFGSHPRGPGKKFAFPKMNHSRDLVVEHLDFPSLINPYNIQDSSAELQAFIIAPPEQDERIGDIAALHMILGRGLGSRLHRKLSEELGLAYSVGASYQSKGDLGCIYIGGKFDATRIDQAQGAINRLLNQFRTEEVTAEEAEFTKDTILNHILTCSDSPNYAVRQIEEFMDKGETPKRAIERICRVNPKSILNTARQIIPAGENHYHGILILDPLKDMKESQARAAIYKA